LATSVILTKQKIVNWEKLLQILYILANPE
jgi:hypothetical protein